MLTETNSRILRPLALIDDLFDSSRTKEYRLAVQLGANVLSVAVLDEIYNKIVALERFTFQKIVNPTILMGFVNSAIRQSDILSYPFKNTSLAIINTKSTLIPNALFDANEKETLLKFNHSPESGEKIAVDNLPNLTAKNIYTLPKIIEQQFNELYPAIKITHYSSPLIEQVLLANKHTSKVNVVAHVHPENFEIVIINSGKLMFYNSFNYQSAEDFIYYILFVFEQLKLNPETASVELLGEMEQNSAIYQLLYKYIRNIQFGWRTDALDYGFKISALPRHQYYSLFSQFLFT